MTRAPTVSKSMKGRNWLFTVTNRRKRRGSVSSPRHDNLGTAPIDIAVVPPRRVSGRTKRASCQLPRKRKLSSEQVGAIRAYAATKSLRSLAADFGVSHETVRSVIRNGMAAKPGL